MRGLRLVFALVLVLGAGSALVSLLGEGPPRRPVPTLRVEVLNGCGEAGVAHRAADLLRETGHDVVRVGDAARNFKTDQAAFDKQMARIAEKQALEMQKVRNRFETEMLLRYPDAQKTDSGLMYLLRKKGDGPRPERGSTIVVHYEGRLANGQVFDSSYEKGEPVNFQIGVGRVIKGWDEALMAMQTGEKRTLLLPYWLAYGEAGYPGVIPPRATLIFDVELVDIK